MIPEDLWSRRALPLGKEARADVARGYPVSVRNHDVILTDVLCGVRQGEDMLTSVRCIDTGRSGKREFEAVGIKAGRLIRPL